MARLQSKYFGELDYAPEAVFGFPCGIPAFEEQTEFVFLDQPHTAPLVFMQSLHDSGLCFITIPVTVAVHGYRLELASEDLAVLDLAAHRQPEIGKDVLCLALLTVSEGEAATANLAAPIVLNLHNRKGIQAFQDRPEYSLRHPLPAQEDLVACS
jgi:flagellar assembly factor FliW